MLCQRNDDGHDGRSNRKQGLATTRRSGQHRWRRVIVSADIASGWRGFIDGAIESGTRNAVLLHRALGT